MNKITQREARRLRRRVVELEDVLSKQRRTWSREWPGGVNITNCLHHESALAVCIARKLGHAVVVTTDGDCLQFHALPLGEPS